MDNTKPRVLLVTGGSRGIGAATAILAGQAGYAVGVNYVRQQEVAESVVAEIRAAGSRAVAIPGDVGEPAEVAQMFRQLEEELGPLTHLVNNAAVLNQQARVEEMSPERIERIFRVNVLGTFLCCQQAIRRMSPRYGGRGGAIVNLSSAAARIGSPAEYVDYAASKGAIDTFTIGLAKELAADSIRVNAVRPGIIDTEIHASGGDPDRVARRGHTLPMQRAGTSQEVAQAILWLLSEEASYCTGTILDVTGGR